MFVGTQMIFEGTGGSATKAMIGNLLHIAPEAHGVLPDAPWSYLDVLGDPLGVLQGSLVSLGSFGKTRGASLRGLWKRWCVIWGSLRVALGSWNANGIFLIDFASKSKYICFSIRESKGEFFEGTPVSFEGMVVLLRALGGSGRLGGPRESAWSLAGATCCLPCCTEMDQDSILTRRGTMGEIVSKTMVFQCFATGACSKCQ